MSNLASGLQINFLFSYFAEGIISETYIDRQFNDIYVTRANSRAESIHFDPAEVSEIKFVPLEKFQEMLTDPNSELAPVYADECRDVLYFLRDWFTR